MAFFDLNMPVEIESKNDLGAQSLKESRLRRVVKAMELGYSGIAYNLFVSGVLADSHRSSITPLPLPSLLEASPSLAETVKFHRQVLGVPVGDKFRQYSRITVGVDSLLQAASINRNHPVLRTYVLVAVHPKNQETLDHACRKMEVDLISIDFSRKFSFHMSNSVIRAAVERGVFFEVMYSPAISNLDARRETFKQVQKLVEWTRGRNIIISSASRSVNGLRGPYDVLNMSTLFGLSTEHAKAAISKNCRSLILRGLTQKNCYKLALQVNKHSPDGIIGSDKAWFDVSKVWDPLSSGKGDVVLKANLDSNDRVDEKGPLSRAKKRRRGSGKSNSIPSSRNSAVVLHQNKDKKMDTGAPILGLNLKETKFALDTKVMPNSKTNLTVLEFDTCMKEKNFKIEKFSVPQKTSVGKNNASFSNAMKCLPLEDRTCTKEQNSRIEKTTVPIDAVDVDNKLNISSSVEFLPLDDKTNSKDQISRKENINVPQVTRDGNNNSSFSSDLEFLALYDNAYMKEQNSGIEKVGVPQATGDGDDHSSFSGAVEFLPLDDNTYMKEQKSSMETISVRQTNGDSNSKPSAMEFIPLEDSTYIKEQNYRIQEVNVPQASTVGNTNSKLTTPKDYLPLDDNAYQAMATGIKVTLCQKDVAHVEDASRVTKYKSSINKNTVSSIMNSDSYTSPGNNTSITPPSPSFTGGNSPSKTGVCKDLLEVWKKTSLTSDDGRDSTNRRDPIYNNVSQVETLELKPRDKTVGVKVEQRDSVVLGPDTEVDGFKFEANERHNTEPNVQKEMDTLPMGIGEVSAACANDDGHMGFNLQTSKGRKFRKATVDTLSLRGILKSGLFKRKVTSRKGASSRTNSRNR